MTKQKIIVSVTNDLVVDQRANKICNTLLELGFEVTLVGRKLPSSTPITRNYKTKRFNLLFNKGALFYGCYNIRLFTYLLFKPHHILWSNDLDTLLANFCISKLKGSRLIYDSHEYFTEVPELVERPKVKKTWERLEAYIFPKLKNVTTVCDSIAKTYEKKYGVKVNVLRNVPLIKSDFVKVKPLKLGDSATIIYQGAINVNRGLEHLVDAMEQIKNAALYIIGDGDVFDEIAERIIKNDLSNRVKMLGRIPFEQLHNYTMQADLGVSLEENVGLNYQYALPNKLFDYIQAQVPVLTSDLPEMKAIVEQYDIGLTISEISANNIANTINQLLKDKAQLTLWKTNTLNASIDLCWEKEKQVIYDLIKEIK